MHTRDIVGFIVLPLVLLAAGYLAGSQNQWADVGSLTISWFCSCLALAIVIVGVTGLLVQAPPGEIPLGAAALVYAAAVGVVGVGMVIDAFACDELESLPSSLGEWAGFAVILAALYLAPRLRARPAAGA